MDHFNKTLNNDIVIFNKKIDEAFSQQGNATCMAIETAMSGVRTVVNIPDYYTRAAAPIVSVSYNDFKGEGPITLELLRQTAIRFKLEQVLNEHHDWEAERRYRDIVSKIKEKATYTDDGEYKKNTTIVKWLGSTNPHTVSFDENCLTVTFEEKEINLTGMIEENKLFKKITSLGFVYEHSIEGVEITNNFPLNKKSNDLVVQLENYLVKKEAERVLYGFNFGDIFDGNPPATHQELLDDPAAFSRKWIEAALRRYSTLDTQDSKIFDAYRYSIQKLSTASLMSGVEAAYTFTDTRNEFGVQPGLIFAVLRFASDGTSEIQFNGDVCSHLRFLNTIESFYPHPGNVHPFRYYLEECKRNNCEFETDPTWKPLVHAFKVAHVAKFVKMLKERLLSPK